ncbi:hypothetical protein Taro_003718 [Colocasia esculenta]|uniref:Uncharacterized protein n=1 Tax=Colocasia esculenta TaxID=4460 RepID=A0A843TPJ6_COLES|nr:hypothetical protein [Colocasia esculenta]
MPAHLHCWFTVWNRGGDRRRDLNASALPDAIPGTTSVTCGAGSCMASDKGGAFKRFKRGVCLGRDFECNVKSFVSARQSRGGSVRRRGDAVKLLRQFSVVFGFRRSVRRGNHARTTLRAWVCRRQGGFGVFQLYVRLRGKTTGDNALCLRVPTEPVTY